MKLWGNLDGGGTIGQASGGGNPPATGGGARAFCGEAFPTSDWNNQNREEEDGATKQARFGGLTMAQLEEAYNYL